MEYNIDILVAGCNTTCMHCYVNGGKAPVMSFEDFKYCMGKLSPIFEKLGDKVSFTLDNEIYNHPDAKAILEFVEGKCSSNYYHHGSTTGIAILSHPHQEEIFEILRRNSWTEVSLAIHGAKESHNKIVNNDMGIDSIIKASKLFKEKGFDVWISLMISKELIKDLPKLSLILDEISYDHLLLVIPDYFPTARLIKYQDIRCNIDDYDKMLPFFKNRMIDTCDIEEAISLYNEKSVIQNINRASLEKRLFENETAFFHVDNKLDFYIGNTGAALKYCGNLKSSSSDEILSWIVSAEDNFYETATIHYEDILSAADAGSLKTSKENYVYPSEIAAITAMIQNGRNKKR